MPEPLTVAVRLWQVISGYVSASKKVGERRSVSRFSQTFGLALINLRCVCEVDSGSRCARRMAVDGGW